MSLQTPQEITVGNRKGSAVPLIYWSGSPGRDAIVITHGIYSHAGWFRKSGSLFHELGLSVVAYDRLGSGRSASIAGQVNDYVDFIKELDCVVAWTLERHPETRIHLTGQSYGGLVAVEYASLRPSQLASMTLITPGFASRKTLKLWQRMLVPLLTHIRPRRQFPIPINALDFTDDPDVVLQIEADQLCRRTASARFFWQTLFFMRRARRTAEQINTPVFMALAGKDNICDNSVAHGYFERLKIEDKKIRVYEQSRHSLLRGVCSDEFIEDWKTWILSHEHSRI